MHRRDFIKLSLSASAGLAAASFNGAVFAKYAEPAQHRLIVVLLRGAVDGLNVVVPYGERAYHDARNSIAMGRPGSDGGAIDLDGYFGVHPELADLVPLWQQGTLAFVHAAGSPDATRSHFEAQEYMESGTPGTHATDDGWMNRLLSVLPGPHTPTQAISFGPTLPRILSGKLPATNQPTGRNALRKQALDRPAVADAFAQLYSGSDVLSQAYREGRAAHSEIMASMADEMTQSAQGAPGSNGFSGYASRLGQLLRNDASIQLAFVALGGWDTHVNQGNAKGQLARSLRFLGGGLKTMMDTLGSGAANTTVMVMSEFGRTVHENGNGGTDHGHGNVMWLLGGGIKGGKVYGDWPGLASANLYQGRDLPVTTDFRHVVAQVLERRLGLDDRQLEIVLPNMPINARKQNFVA
jgi:uncharacterized protein (DUF1501 family)